MKSFAGLHDQAGNIFDPLGYMLLIKLTRVSSQTDVFFTLLCKACFIFFNQQSRSFLSEREPLFAFQIWGGDFAKFITQHFVVNLPSLNIVN